MIETQTKEVLHKEIQVNFFVKDVIVQERDLGNHYEYNKLYITIRDEKKGELRHQYVSPENLTIRNILKNIEKLNEIYRRTDNEKLAEGVKEEILKLVALLLWTLG